MRFKVDMQFWLEATTLAQAERVIQAAQAAAGQAFAELAIDDPATGAAWTCDYTGVDDAAIAALAEDDLGPGRSTAFFRRQG